MAIDAHTHYNSKETKKLYKHLEHINNYRYIDYIINVGTDIETSTEIIELAEDYPKMYITIGIHPKYIKDNNCEELYNLYNLSDKIVAIGETGLTNSADYELQKKYFEQQIAIANNLKLPLIVHSKGTVNDILDIFKYKIKPLYGVLFHSFQGSIKELNYINNNGMYVSFANSTVYSKNNEFEELIKQVDRNLLLVETSSPYDGFNNEINNSANISLIIERIAQIEYESYLSMEEITTKNAKTLFKKLK